MRFPVTKLQSLGIGLLGLGVPLAFVPSAEDAYFLPQMLALALALLCLAAAGLAGEKPAFKIGLFETLAAAYYAWRLFSWHQNNFSQGLSGRLGRDTLYFGLFVWASQNLQARQTQAKVRNFVIAGMGIACLYGVLQAYGWDPFMGHRVDMGFGARAHATFGNPDFFGSALILVLPLVLATYLNTGKQALLAWLFILALLLTQTRAAWLGFGAGSALLIFCLRAELKLKILSFLAAGLLGLVLVFSVPNPLNVQRVSLVKRVSASGLSGRMMMARVALAVAREHPFLGVGSGEAYTKAYLIAQGRLLNAPEFSGEPYRYTSDVHNDWLQVAGEAGLPGFLIFFWLWAGLLWRCLKKRGVQAVAVAAALLSFGANALFHFPLAVIPSGALCWLFLGWAAALTRGSGKNFGGTGVFYGALLLLSLGLAWATWISLQASVLLNRGMSLSLAGHLQQAEISLLRATRLAQSDPRPWMRLGLNRDSLGDNYAAVDDFSQALRRQPALPEALGNLGLAEAKLGRLAEARQYFLSSLEVNPRSVETLGNLGKIEYLRGDFGAAQEAYERGLTMNLNWSQGHFNLAALFINTKRPLLAREHLEAVLRLEPNHTEAARLLQGLRR
jgi:putative inorganic carbon (HCO3(-)) transporter